MESVTFRKTIELDVYATNNETILQYLSPKRRRMEMQGTKQRRKETPASLPMIRLTFLYPRYRNVFSHIKS